MVAINRVHTFHIPVMGTAFTIDTPVKVAKFGISSVVSIGDDELCENMREYYAGYFKKPFSPIKKYDDNHFRSRRITAYLDLIHDIVTDQINEIKAQEFSNDSDLTKYFEMLPESDLKNRYQAMLNETDSNKKKMLQNDLREHVLPGSIDVNIMTKLDRVNVDKEGKVLPDEFSDACSAFKGFADSKLDASIIFSAGFNRRLFAFIENFDDFFPDKNGKLKKKIILKVSDVRSSLIQGKFLAKKGVWVSEYRVESGLNCGGHAFASDGYLLGPILEEFKTERASLRNTFFKICNDALAKNNRHPLSDTQEFDVTVQGGIGTANEQDFLMQFYDVEGTGWATPFLLVPEATTLDHPTRKHLEKATSDDLYLSEISPLGIPFNTVKGTPSERQRLERIENGRPGSPCPKGYLISNQEFTKKPICTASVAYQKRKLKAIETGEVEQDPQDLLSNPDKVILKTCLCEDLAAGALIDKGIDNKRPLKSAVCPGPNLAYFSKISPLADMVAHIYGRINLLNSTPRSNMFISELKMYIDYLKKEISKSLPKPTPKDIEYFNEFKANLTNGIQYYKDLIPKLKHESDKYRNTMKNELTQLKSDLETMFNSFNLDNAQA